MKPFVNEKGGWSIITSNKEGWKNKTVKTNCRTQNQQWEEVEVLRSWVRREKWKVKGFVKWLSKCMKGGSNNFLLYGGDIKMGGKGTGASTMQIQGSLFQKRAMEKKKREKTDQGSVFSNNNTKQPKNTHQNNNDVVRGGRGEESRSLVLENKEVRVQFVHHLSFDNINKNH